VQPWFVLWRVDRHSERRGPESLREYVVFIDSDMKLTRTVLEDCVKTFTERDAALVIPEVDIGESYWARVRDSNAPFTRASGGFRAPDVSGKHSF